MPLHSALVLENGIHTVVALRYPNAASRIGAVGLAATDLGKIAQQSDDSTLWLLSAVTPAVVWSAVNTDSTASILSDAADYADGAAASAVGAIPDATAEVRGLATATQISKLDALPSDAQSAQQVSDAASGAASSAVAGIPDATASVKGLATAAQISKLDGLPPDAQSASQVSSAASAAVSAIPDATTLVKGLATTALVTDVAASKATLTEDAEADALLSTSVFHRSADAPYVQTVVRCGSPGITTWNPASAWTLTTGQPNSDGTASATKYVDNSTVAAYHQLTTTNFTPSLPNAFACSVRARFSFHPGNLRIFKIGVQGTEAYFDAFTGDFDYVFSGGEAQAPGSKKRFLPQNIKATKASGGYYDIDFTAVAAAVVFDQPVLTLQPCGSLDAPTSGRSIYDMYYTTRQWTDNTRYFYASPPILEYVGVTSQLDLSASAIDCAQSTVLNTPMVAPYNWGGKQVIQWCADATNTESLVCDDLATVLSGTAKPFTLQMLLHPQVTPTVDTAIFYASGTTASLGLIWGANGNWYVSRTTDAAATTMTTSLGKVGLIGHVLTIVYDGETVTVYQDTRVSGTFTLGGGATTLTDCRFGASVEYFDAEAAVYDYAMSAANVRLSAIALGKNWGYDPDQPWNIIVFGGQSLALGYASLNDMSRTHGEVNYAAPKLAARLNYYNLDETPVFRPWNMMRGGNGSQADKVGPEWGMALEAEDRGKKIGVIKHAVGGTALASYWAPGQAGYGYLEAYYATSIAQLGDVPYDVKACAMVQWQGDSDASNYLNNLRLFSAGVRAYTGKPNLRIVWDWPHKDTTAYGQKALCQAALKTWAATDVNARLVAHDDVRLFISDNTHCTADGTIELGRRMFRAMGI